MTDGQMLLLVLWLLYATECFLWLNRYTMAFVAPWGTKWRVATASTIFGNASGGLLFLNPFPPLGQFCLNQPIPVSISPEFIVACNSQISAPETGVEQTGEVLALSDIQEVSTWNGDLWLNGQRFCRGGGNANLQPLAELVDALRNKTQDERIASIEAFWSHQFDLNDAKHEQALFYARTTRLRLLCSTQFLYLFIVLPVLMTAYGVTTLLIPSAVVMILLAGYVAVEFFRVHKERWPEQKGKRVAGAIKFILCPPVCIRAMDLLMVHSHSRHHSLTLGSLLIPDKRAEAFISGILRDLRYPVTLTSAHETTISICKWQNGAIERLAAKHLLPVARCVQTLDDEPVPQASDCQSYCPRCLTQFTFKNADCRDCPGVPLVPFVP